MTVVTRIQSAGRLDVPAGLVFGTSVLTPFGSRRVENLRPGELVVTRDHGPQPLRTVWSQTFDAAEVAADPSLAPIRLAPRALGPMMPRREVLLAGGDRILVPGWRTACKERGVCRLIAAGEIAGRAEGVRVDRSAGAVTYVSLLFDRHHVIQAEGLLVGTYHPTPAAMSTIQDEMRAEIVELLAQLGTSPSSYPPPDHPVASGEEYLADAP